MIQVFSLSQIKKALEEIDPLPLIEEGFIAYSQGKTVVPPVGELIFRDPPGDIHIKYGYIIGDDYYVIKIASGFPANRQRNLPPNNGMMLVFKQKTGEPVCILLDQGFLTDIRTAAAGAVVAKYLAPKKVHCIGILGPGIQGRMQLEYLKGVVDCREVIIWGRNLERLEVYRKDMEPLGFHIQPTLNTEEVAARCDLIVTATPSTTPLLHADDIRPGTHITAMGSDTPEKNELNPQILHKADILVADSISQCLERGEIHHALNTGTIKKEKLVELGDVIINQDLRRSSEEQITVADLTGVAVQDIQRASAVCNILNLK
ncbi:MAG: ornithine cyclodeaminase family protein [Candidatus Aminicenantales bacterium]